MFLPVGLLQNKLALYAIGALAIVLALVGAYVKGRYDGAEKVELEVAQDHIEWQATIDLNQSLFDASVQQFWNSYLQSSTIRKEVVKYVDRDPIIQSVYVPLEVDNGCVINKGFVELHNKAVADADIASLQNTDINANKAPSKHKLSDVAKTITLNYYEYNQLKDQIIALQQTVREFQAKQEALND